MLLIPAVRRQRQRLCDCCEFEVSLVYRATSRPARTAQRSPVSKNKTTNPKKKMTFFFCSRKSRWSLRNNIQGCSLDPLCMYTQPQNCLNLPNSVLWTSSMAFCFSLPSLINSSILLNRLLRLLPKLSWASALCTSIALLRSSLECRPDKSLVVSLTVLSNCMFKNKQNKKDNIKTVTNVLVFHKDLSLMRTRHKTVDTVSYANVSRFSGMFSPHQTPLFKPTMCAKKTDTAHLF